jgi:hypothetical protein
MSVETKNEIQAILEDLKLDEEIFTEEVMGKIKLVVESKVAEKLEVEKEKLEEQNKEELSEFKEDMIDRFDEYTTYFVEEFTKDNEQDIIDSVKVKTAERVLENFNKMVNEFNMSLSEETVDQSDKLDGLESDLNESINENIELKKELAESNKYAMILDRVMKIETEVEKSRFAKLAESFDYEDEDSFNTKLETLQESLVETVEENIESLTETENYNSETVLEESTETSPKSKYLKVLHRTA